MKQQTQNTFRGGIVIDDLGYIGPANSSMTDCLNCEYNTYEGNEGVLQNNKGNEYKARLKPNYVPVGVTEYQGIAYIFSAETLNEGFTGRGEVGMYPSPDYVNQIQIDTVTVRGDLVEQYKPLMNYFIDTNLSNISIAQDESLILFGHASAFWGEFNSSFFNFTQFKPLEIEVQVSYDNTINLIFTDNYNRPRLINTRIQILPNNRYQITNRLGSKDTNLYSELDFESTLNLFQQSSKIIDIEFSGISNGGNLPSGMYYLYFRYLTQDFNSTNIIGSTRAIPIYHGDVVTEIHGGTPDGQDNTNKIIEITLTGLDLSFAYIEVIVEHHYGKLSDNISYYVLDKFYTVTNSQIVINVTGFEGRKPFNQDLLNLTTGSVATARTMTQSNSRLLLGNIKYKEYNLADLIEFGKQIKLGHVQKSLHSIGASDSEDDIYNLKVTDKTPVSGSTPTDVGYTGGYYNPFNVHDYLGYWGGESYMFGIVFIYKDGTESPVIPVQGIDNWSNTALSTDAYNTAPEPAQSNEFFETDYGRNYRGWYRFPSRSNMFTVPGRDNNAENDQYNIYPELNGDTNYYVASNQSIFTNNVSTTSIVQPTTGSNYKYNSLGETYYIPKFDLQEITRLNIFGVTFTFPEVDFPKDTVGCYFVRAKRIEDVITQGYVIDTQPVFLADAVGFKNNLIGPTASTTPSLVQKYWDWFENAGDSGVSEGEAKYIPAFEKSLEAVSVHPNADSGSADEKTLGDGYKGAYGTHLQRFSRNFFAQKSLASSNKSRFSKDLVNNSQKRFAFISNDFIVNKYKYSNRLQGSKFNMYHIGNSFFRRDYLSYSSFNGAYKGTGLRGVPRYFSVYKTVGHGITSRYYGGWDTGFQYTSPLEWTWTDNVTTPYKNFAEAIKGDIKLDWVEGGNTGITPRRFASRVLCTAKNEDLSYYIQLPGTSWAYFSHTYNDYVGLSIDKIGSYNADTGIFLTCPIKNIGSPLHNPLLGDIGYSKSLYNIAGLEIDFHKQFCANALVANIYKDNSIERGSTQDRERLKSSHRTEGLTYIPISKRMYWSDAFKAEADSPTLDLQDLYQRPRTAVAYGGDCFINTSYRKLYFNTFNAPVLPKSAWQEGSLAFLSTKAEVGPTVSMITESNEYYAFRIQEDVDITEPYKRSFLPLSTNQQNSPGEFDTLNESYSLPKFNSWRKYQLPETYWQNIGGQAIHPTKVSAGISLQSNFFGDQYDTRIIYTGRYVRGNTFNPYRTLNDLNYEDYDRSMGEIVKIIDQGGRVYIIQENGVSVINVEGRTMIGNTSEGSEILLGVDKALTNPGNTLSDEFGTKWQWSVVKTDNAIYGVDIDKNVIWQTSGGQLVLISKLKIASQLKKLSAKFIETQLDILFNEIRSYWDKGKNMVGFVFHNQRIRYFICDWGDYLDTVNSSCQLVDIDLVDLNLLGQCVKKYRKRRKVENGVVTFIIEDNLDASHPNYIASETSVAPCTDCKEQDPPTAVCSDPQPLVKYITPNIGVTCGNIQVNFRSSDLDKIQYFNSLDQITPPCPAPNPFFRAYNYWNNVEVHSINSATNYSIQDPACPSVPIEFNVTKLEYKPSSSISWIDITSRLVPTNPLDNDTLIIRVGGSLNRLSFITNSPFGNDTNQCSESQHTVRLTLSTGEQLISSTPQDGLGHGLHSLSKVEAIMSGTSLDALAITVVSSSTGATLTDIQLTSLVPGGPTALYTVNTSGSVFTYNTPSLSPAFWLGDIKITIRSRKPGVCGGSDSINRLSEGIFKIEIGERPDECLDKWFGIDPICEAKWLLVDPQDPTYYHIKWDEAFSVWRTRHDYYPIMAFNRYNKHFTFNLERDRSEVWEHHVNMTRCNYYGDQKEFHFEFVINEQIQSQKIFENFTVISNEVPPFYIEYTNDNEDLIDDVAPIPNQDKIYITQRIRPRFRGRYGVRSATPVDPTTLPTGNILVRTNCMWKENRHIIEIGKDVDDTLDSQVPSTQTFQTNRRLRDKFIRIKFRYEGHEYSTIVAIQTKYLISFS